MKARPYQAECNTSISQAFRRGIKRALVELATGTGKMIIIALAAAMAIARHKRVLILCNRDILVSQAADKLMKCSGIYCGIEKGMERASKLRDVVVASVQTLQGDRLKRWGRDHFDLVIADEAHGATAKTWRNVLNHFDKAYHIGFSATVERHDKQGIGWFYEEIVYEMPLVTREVIDPETGEVTGIVKGAINEGWLSPLVVKQIPVPVILDERITNKDSITEEEEAFALEPYLERLAGVVAQEIRNRKALIFLPTIKASEFVAQTLRDLGVDCKHVDSTRMKSAETRRRLQWFKHLKQGAMCNSSLLTTGYDQPDIDCIVILRFIRSTPLYKQIVGRGTRPVADVDNYHTPEERKAAIAASDKKNCLILDMMIQNSNHNFAGASCLVSKLKEEGDKVKQAGANFIAETDLEELGVKLKEIRITEVHNSLKKMAEAVANAGAKSKPKEPFIYDILQKHGGDRYKRASDSQKGVMCKLGVDNSIQSELNTKQAQMVISRYMDFRGWKKKTK